MKPTDIIPGKVYTNGKNRFRRVTELHKVGGRIDAHYTAAYRNTKGRMKATVPMMGGGDRSGTDSFAAWAIREATAEERAEVLAALNIKEPT